ncbi:MAG TPA: alkaline phosphatase family protein [Actinomycetota bacterium]|nr:alkaline phosphatase family protein [Actinomycetota bacterium]
MSRVAAIGLDGAEWTFVETLLADGELPNLAAIRARSTHVDLTNEDVGTALVWEAFVTGHRPPSSAVRFDEADYTVVQALAPDEAPFWTKAGVRTIAFDVPLLSLAEVGPGLHVTSWGAHGAAYPRASKPNDLLAEIDARFGVHPAYHDDKVEWNDPDSVRDLEERLVAGAAIRRDVAQFLLEREPDWQLFLTMYSETHSAGEAFWHAADPQHLLSTLPATKDARRALVNVYKAVDASIGELVSALPGDVTVVLFSVHGMKQNTGDVPSGMLLPELLYRLRFDEPFLEQPNGEWWGSKDKPAVVPPRGTWPVPVERRLASESPTRLVKRAVRRLLPRSVENFLILQVEKRREQAEGPAESVPKSLSLRAHVPSWYRSAWPKMDAFALPTFADGRVRINLQGRESTGTVPPDDYEETRSRIARELLACRDPRTGEPVVEELVMLEGDPRAAHPTECDIRIVWKENVDSLEHPTAGAIGPFRLGRTGGHTERGFAFIATPGGRGAELGTRPARDLVPTLLTLVGQEVPEPIEGSAIDPIHARTG